MPAAKKKTPAHPPKATKTAFHTTMKKARALVHAGRHDQAITLVRGIVRRTPSYLPGWNLIARAQERAGRPAQARKTRERALAEEVVTLCDKAERARELNRHEVSRRLLERALELEPECPNAIWWLADYWHDAGRPTKALPLYKRFLAIEPDDPEALHMIAALGGRKAPRHAPDDYVRRQFDSYAEDFDKSLVGDLDYQAPQLIARALAKVRGKETPRADVADLGCGTGLMGMEVASFAKSLSGVDLSPKMIREARKRRIYDRLAVDEITRYLRKTRRKYDVIVCADVIIYVGDVTEMFRAIAESLRPGGLFAFSVEWCKGPGFKLTGTGRYAHSPEWLRRTAAASGLEELHAFRDRLRYEKGLPVKGYISVMGLTQGGKAKTKGRGKGR